MKKVATQESSPWICKQIMTESIVNPYVTLTVNLKIHKNTGIQSKGPVNSFGFEVQFKKRNSSKVCSFALLVVGIPRSIVTGQQKHSTANLRFYRLVVLSLHNTLSVESAEN